MLNLMDLNNIFYNEEACVPESLLEQCFVCIVRDLSTICLRNETTNLYELRPGLVLPRELCEKLVQVYCKNVGSLDDKFVNIFSNASVTSLKRVCLRNSSVSDKGLKALLEHKLVDLKLERCTNVTSNCLSVLNQHGENLLSLVVGTDVKLLPSVSNYGVTIPSEYPGLSRVIAGVVVPGDELINPVLNTPKLRRLTVHNYLFGQNEKPYFDNLFQHLHNLTHLDFSCCMKIKYFSFLPNLKNLNFLVLHNVVHVQDGLPYICQMKNLRHLDISQSSDKVRTFHYANETLAEIVNSLPNLESLDISGTNLAGTGVAQTKYQNKQSTGEMCDIPGLNSRISNKFKFLGLYGTLDSACRRHDIPAINISGDANERQILNAAKAYIDRPEVLQRVLNDLYHLFRYEHCHLVFKALYVVLDAMERHISEKHIQISGSATLFYIVKNKNIPPFPPKIKRTIISSLLNGMNAHKDDDTMMRNGCLTLCQFKIPQDVLFEYERLVTMLLHIVSDMEQEGFVQRIGIYLLNSLACQVDNYQKKLLGDLCAIEKMLMLIEDRVKRMICDDVLEVAWSTMWNVTDEAASCCDRFLNGRGMEYFLKCLSLFPQKDELVRNMMGLLGNVAEVKELRNKLMVPHYIEVFLDLVRSYDDGIEVSYNAAGVLSHLASDGPDCWRISEPAREQVLNTMVVAIDHWNLDTERNINYRSFKPILQLAKVRHTPQCQHWAVWALANLTRVYPEKYCLLVESEGGIEILQQIIVDDAPYDSIKNLAKLVLQQCEQFKTTEQENETPQLDG